jgi:signal peptide peptidase SppA, 36K type
LWAGCKRRELGELFEDAARQEDIVGVVLRVNSGGGSIVETKEVARRMGKLRGEKPVVAWIGEVGASGAYYVAAHTDYIMADEDAMVGSIGVISVLQNYQDLFEDKLGINTTVVKSGEYKDMGSPYRAMTEEEEERFQEIVDTVHEEFMQVISARRGLSAGQREEVGTSKLFLGSEALKLGLVDRTGGFFDAVDYVKTAAGYPGAEPYYMEPYGSGGLLGLSYGMGRGLGDSLRGEIDPSDALISS